MIFSITMWPTTVIAKVFPQTLNYLPLLLILFFSRFGNSGGKIFLHCISDDIFENEIRIIIIIIIIKCVFKFGVMKLFIWYPTRYKNIFFFFLRTKLAPLCFSKYITESLIICKYVDEKCLLPFLIKSLHVPHLTVTDRWTHE